MDKLEGYADFCQTSMMEISAERVNGFQPLTIIVKSFIADALQGSE